MNNLLRDSLALQERFSESKGLDLDLAARCERLAQKLRRRADGKPVEGLKAEARGVLRVIVESGEF